MSENSAKRSWLNVLLVLVFIGGVAGWGCYFFVRAAGERTLTMIVEKVKESEEQGSVLIQMATQMKEKEEAREKEIAGREEELRQREAAIAGREDAATERTQSSFQGLLIQQQLTRNLEALKASLPDMTPEVEKLAREHAQLGAERQRLEKENADLRRQIGQPGQPLLR